MLNKSSTAPPVEEIAETPFYIPATSSSSRPRRTLKHGDCFAVLDSYADIGALAGGPDGLFHSDTRHLSHLEMLLNGKQPLLLGSTVRDDNSILTVDLTNPDMYADEELVLPKDILHVVRTVFLLRGSNQADALGLTGRCGSPLTDDFNRDLPVVANHRGRERSG